LLLSSRDLTRKLGAVWLHGDLPRDQPPVPPDLGGYQVPCCAPWSPLRAAVEAMECWARKVWGPKSREPGVEVEASTVGWTGGEAGCGSGEGALAVSVGASSEPPTMADDVRFYPTS
jgi:hypothetical protein